MRTSLALALLTLAPTPVSAANIKSGTPQPSDTWLHVTLLREETYNSAPIRVKNASGNRFVFVQNYEFWTPRSDQSFLMIDNGVGIPGSVHDVSQFTSLDELHITIGPLRLASPNHWEQRFRYDDGEPFWLPAFRVPETTSLALVLCGLLPLRLLAEPNCSKRRCKHFQGVSDAPEERQVPVCSAFPDGIPASIAYGDDLHLTPVPNDHGIQFEQGA